MNANYQDLANGIVVRAAKDYRKVLKKSLCFPSSSTAKNEISRLEDFFSSDYYKLLTSLDSEKLIEQLRQEVQDDSERISG